VTTIKRTGITLLVCIIAFAGCQDKCRKANEPVRTIQSFDENWYFFRGDISGGEKKELDDSGWRQLDVPHDWSIEDIPGTGSPFDSTILYGASSGFVQGGTGWYRKYFTLKKDDAGRRVFICFDGIYMNSDLWVNGKHLGNHFYGYTGFEFDITDYVKFGEKNLIAIQVKNEWVKCRWYTGSGIYRHVWLTVTDPLYIKNWGTAITTTGISDDFATVSVSSGIVNRYPDDKAVTIRYKIIDKDRRVVARNEVGGEVKSRKEAILKTQLQVSEPQCWSPECPVLYSLESEVYADGQPVDCTVETFGIRSIRFDAETGFLLNGKPVELKGGCIHHDNGPLGALALDRAEERKIELHKAAGFNALRMAHNPPSTALLDACDRLGMLVIDEAFDVWIYEHFKEDYATYFNQLWQSDVSSMIWRDRNHPSVIMWSIGNEIKKTDTEELVVLCKTVSDFARALDPTRPVTVGVNAINETQYPFLEHPDICGYNYSPEQYETSHEENPDWVMYGSESYASESYDYWKAVEKYPWVIGDFVWTSFDYIGEVSIGWRGYPLEPDAFPWNLAYCGDIGICGDRRPQSYYRQTFWSSEPLTYITVTPPVPSFPLNPRKERWSVWDWADEIPCWNFDGQESKPLQVNVYSSCEEVELFLNGKSLGKQKNEPEKNKNIIRWKVPYQAGELKAVGFSDGEEATLSVLKTAGKPSKIVLTPDRKTLSVDGQDLSYIKVELTDADGVKNPVAEDSVHFEIHGPGVLVAVGNSNPMSLESFRKPSRKAWRGECLAIVKAGKNAGTVRVVAKVDGLPDTEVVLDCKEP
jgi:beta-galactosidase